MTPDGQVELTPETPPARLRQDATAAGWIDVNGSAVELFDISADRVEDLPAPRPGVWLVVPRVVADACTERRDLVFPYREVRDDMGRVIGCAALGRPAQEDR
ncbi:MAG: hypothetical protein ACRD0H_07270 [Actinomycetes bacterium]